MYKQLWNDGWKFWRDTNSFQLIWSVPEDALCVTLPHDAMISENADPDSLNGVSTAFRSGCVCIYDKVFTVPAEDEGKSIVLKFEGIYMNAFIYVNGAFAGSHPYGYTSFYVPIDRFLKYGGENEIRIQVRNGAMPNSRWYSGTGIYRDVYYLTGEKTHFVPQGLKLETKKLDGISEDFTAAAGAELRISAEVRNEGAAAESLRLRFEIENESGAPLCSGSTYLTLSEGEEKTAALDLKAENIRLWSDRSPVRYRCHAFLEKQPADAGRLSGAGKSRESQLLDEEQCLFGFRTIHADAENGLLVNGRKTVLRGCAVHHDGGLLGAATYAETEMRRISRLRASGFNAVRMAHNPCADVLLEACDRLGMYVMDEAFDMWTRSKSDYDYSMFFADWWERDIESMVRKDMNHPSVLIYSIGNEIPEIGSAEGASWCGKISAKVRSLDDSRIITAAVNGVFAAGEVIGQIMSELKAEEKKTVEGLVKESSAAGSAARSNVNDSVSDANNAEAVTADDGALEKYNVNDFMTEMDAYMERIVRHPAVTERLDRASEHLDAAGYNYMTARYESDRKERPDRVIIGSETYPPQLAENVRVMKDLPNVIGDFTWTGWDYIGEAGIGIPGYRFGEGGMTAAFPCQLSYCADFDLTGYKRPACYYQEIVYGFRKAPYIAVQDPQHYGQHLWRTPWMISDAISSWTFRGCEGRPVIAEVYSGGDETELFLNGKSLGRKSAGENATASDGITKGFRTLFETVYEPGTLTAVTYEKGQETGRYELRTAKDTAEIRITAEVSRLNHEAGTAAPIFADIELLDEDGVLVTDRDILIEAKVEGNAKIAGFGSGDPKPEYGYTGHVTKTFRGRAQLILIAADENFRISVTEKH